MSRTSESLPARWTEQIAHQGNREYRSYGGVERQREFEEEDSARMRGGLCLPVAT